VRLRGQHLLLGGKARRGGKREREGYEGRVGRYSPLSVDRSQGQNLFRPDSDRERKRKKFGRSARAVASISATRGVRRNWARRQFPETHAGGLGVRVAEISLRF